METRFYDIIFCLASLFILQTNSQSCLNAFACQNVEINSLAGVSAYGYKSNVGSAGSITTQNYSPISCHGAFSCNAIGYVNSTAASVACGASNACTNVTSALRAGPNYQFWCHGANACSGSNIRAEWVYCYADQSCSYSNIKTAFRIYLYGSYALYNGVIDSTGARDDGMSVTLYGHYAGYGATIICQPGHSCTITCYGNSCFMLYLDCRGTCTVNNYSTNADCDPIDDINIYTQKLTESGFSFLYNSVIDSINNDIICDQTNNLKYDNYQQHYQSTAISASGQTICCRARDSCRNIPDIQVNSGNRDIVCSGYYSCAYVDLIENNFGSVYCEGQGSCFESNITTANNIYCLGVQSCWESEGHTLMANNVYCGGNEGCRFATIHSIEGNQLSVYFLGKDSGRQAYVYCNLHSDCNIYCGARSACDSTTVICNGCNSHTIINDDSYWCPIINVTPTTANPTQTPTTSHPTTINPTTSDPTTSDPTTTVPTSAPTTSNPTSFPTTMNPTTSTSESGDCSSNGCNDKTAGTECELTTEKGECIANDNNCVECKACDDISSACDASGECLDGLVCKKKNIFCGRCEVVSGVNQIGLMVGIGFVLALISYM